MTGSLRASEICQELLNRLL